MDQHIALQPVGWNPASPKLIADLRRLDYSQLTG
jgi:hypothetical protein